MFEPDLVLLNAVVLTMDERDSTAEAIAVTGDRFALVGSNADIQPHIGPTTTVVDLGGRPLLPGFIDNHIHLTSAYQRRWVDCSSAVCQSIPDVAAALADRAGVTPPGAWVIGREFDPARLKEGRYPNRHDLDPAIPDHPVAIVNRENGGWTFNTRALRMMGVTDDTPDPPGGLLERDEQGRPLGPMWDAARTVFINPALPQPTLPDLIEDYRWMSAELLKVGVTTIHEAGYRETPHARAWQELRRSQSGPIVRVHLGPYPLGGPEWNEHGAPGSLVRSGLSTGFGDDWLRIGSLQLAVDGGVFGETAALGQPYANRPDFQGNFRVDKATLTESVTRSVAGGWQVGLICHGDAGIDRALTAIEACGPDGSRSQRLEHAYIWTPRLMDRAAAAGVIWNTQPVVLTLVASQLRAMLSDHVRWAFPFRSMLERGITISGGSDWVVGPINPLLGIDALVSHRSDASDDAPQLVEEETVSIRDAIRIYTVGGAIAGREKDTKGAIEPGKLADFVILDRNPLTAPAKEVRDIRVVATYLGGRLVFAAEGYEPPFNARVAAAPPD